MSIIDRLLETDVEKLQVNNTKKYEVKRLSKLIGEPFIVDCRPLTNEQIVHIGEVSKTNVDMKFNVIIEACRIEDKRFNNKELIDKFGVVRPLDLLDKLFLPGEISKLYDIVNEISGYSNDAVQEIKN